MVTHRDIKFLSVLRAMEEMEMLLPLWPYECTESERERFQWIHGRLLKALNYDFVKESKEMTEDIEKLLQRIRTAIECDQEDRDSLL